MDIKKLVKLSFIVISIFIMIIASVNYIMLLNLKNNNASKVQISKLVYMQENMNALLKDVKNSENLKQLDLTKRSFLAFELEFENIKDQLEARNINKSFNMFTENLYKDEKIYKNIKLLFSNEKEIEKAFDAIYDLKKEDILLSSNINKFYTNESSLRKEIAQEIIKTKNIFLIEHLGNMQYYSKETLFQYRNQKYLNKWINEIDSINDKYDNTKLNEYKLIVGKLGKNVVRLNNIENLTNELKSKITKILSANKKVNENISDSINTLSEVFIKNIYNIMIFLLVITILTIIIVAYKVNKNVGLSVDEVNKRIEDGLKEIHNLNDEIENTQKEVVFTMGAIGESRSKETGNHVKRVAEYSKILGLHYGLEPDEAEMLKQASPMHDIGKVAIPDAILNKPGRFDENERKIMDTHAQLGYDMLKMSNRKLLKTAAIVAYQHHEKWDGSGYPNALKGEEIHIYGRITALADVFDALGSDRVYKKAWDDERIFKLFKEERGKHFDPKLIDIFFDNLNKFLHVRAHFKDKV